jgi:retron-type reverse transcriptase
VIERAGSPFLSFLIFRTSREMAYTFKRLWPAVVSWENLLAAYHKCRRRKRYKRGAVEFDFAWERNLLELQEELTAETYVPGPYRHFFVHDPKRRRISAAPFRDRVVHHALVHVSEPLFERRFLFDSYACRRGKGTHRALDRAEHFLRRFPYYLQTDVVQFFPNVDHEILIGLLRETIADPRVMRLVETVIGSGADVFGAEASPTFFPGDDLFSALRPRGLPIGNLTSQFFANVLLDRIDHVVKDELAVPGYVRYADDFVLFAETKSELRSACDIVSRELQKLRLRLHPNKTHLRPREYGLKFLGFHLGSAGRRLTREAVRRFVRRRRRLQADFGSRRFDGVAVRRSLQAWGAHTSVANHRGLKRALMRDFVLSRR